MSTIDPRHRLHRRPWFLPVVRGVLWTLAGIGVFAIAFALTAFPFNDSGMALGLAPLPLLCVIYAGFTDAYTEVPERAARYLLPYLAWMIGIGAAASGAGVLLGRAWPSLRGSTDGYAIHHGSLFNVLGAALLLGGLGLLVVSTWLRTRQAALAVRARSVRLTGPRVPAVVTEVSRWHQSNVVEMWDTTLRFTDSQGTDRWHTAVHHVRLQPGSRQWIRYDPEAPGRKSSIFVEWTR